MLISDMKEFAKRLILFSVFFLSFSIFVNCLFLVIITSTDWDFIKRLESLQFEEPDYELLVLGSSLAEYGVDTEVLTNHGIKSFNLSLVGSSVKTNYVQLNEYLTRYPKKPQFAVLAVNSVLEQFDQDGIQPVVEFTMKGHRYNHKDLPISKFNWAGMELLKKAFRKKYRETYLSYGHKKSIITQPDNTVFREFHIDFNKFETAYWMGELAKLCSENAVELIITDIPGVREAQSLSGVGPYTIRFGNGYTAQYYNLNSIEFCKFIDGENDWVGLSHLNKTGAAKFTQKLYEVVLEKRVVAGYESDNYAYGILSD